MKHIDIRYKCVNEYVKDGVVKIIFSKFAENGSNILMKKWSAELHEQHTKKMVGEMLVDASSFGLSNELKKKSYNL